MSGPRTEAIARQREAYAYDWSYQSLPFVKELPRSEKFSASYVAASLAATARLEANKAAYVATHPLKRERAESVEDFDALYPLLEAPLSTGLWREDWAFAWQRIAGSVPTELRRVERLQDNLRLTQKDYERALGEGERLEAAIAEGRLYVADYAIFDGIPCGRFPPTSRDGARKHLEAPIAVFVEHPGAKAGIAPVAIQTGQRDAPIYTPADGDRWALAKLAVQVADANLEGIVVHFGYTHMIVQRFILAARRNLHPDHPLLHLLAPHFEHTLAANQYARESLVVVDGVQDRILCPLLPATHAVLRECQREVELADLDPVIDAERHGVMDLKLHPFRDDGVDAWRATKRWVEAYVSLFYASDADAAADHELRAMIDEVGSPDGGQLPRMVAGVRTDTRAAIAEVIARIIHRASTYHAAINYDWWDWMGHVPNGPSVCVAPLPGPGEPSRLLDMLPPLQVAWETIDQIYGVSRIAVNRLGEYPLGFADPRVRPHLEVYRRELAEVEARIEARNRARPVPYTCLLPSRTTASINS